MPKIKGVYKITSKLKSTKFYIGSSMHIKRRWDGHRLRILNNRDCCPILGHYFRKHGIDDMEFEILEQFDNPTKELLLEREQFYIDTLSPPLNASKTARTRYGSKNSKEANKNVIKSLKSRDHPTRGKKRPPEVCAKISESLMGHPVNKQTRKNQSRVAKKGFKEGRQHPMEGKKHRKESIEKMKHPKSEQGRENMRLARKNKIISPEEYEKRSQSCKGRIPWNKGKKMPQEVRDNMSKAKKGKPSSNKGKKASPETIEKQRISHLGQIPAMKGRHYPPEQAKQIKEKRRNSIINKTDIKTSPLLTSTNKQALK